MYLERTVIDWHYCGHAILNWEGNVTQAEIEGENGDATFDTGLEKFKNFLHFGCLIILIEEFRLIVFNLFHAFAWHD